MYALRVRLKNVKVAASQKRAISTFGLITGAANRFIKNPGIRNLLYQLPNPSTKS
jgi:hypothetical protein